MKNNRKTRTQPALASLSEDQLNDLDLWLETMPYDRVLERMAQPEPFGFDLIASRKVLEVRFQKIQTTRLLAQHAEQTLTVNELEALYTGQPLPFDSAGLNLIMKNAFDLALRPDNTPAQIKDLLHIFSYNHARTAADRRLNLSEASFELKKARFDSTRGTPAMEGAAETSTVVSNRYPIPDHPDRRYCLGGIKVIVEDQIVQNWLKMGLDRDLYRANIECEYAKHGDMEKACHDGAALPHKLVPNDGTSPSRPLPVPSGPFDPATAPFVWHVNENEIIKSWAEVGLDRHAWIANYRKAFQLTNDLQFAVKFASSLPHHLPSEPSRPAAPVLDADLALFDHPVSPSPTEKIDAELN